MTAIDLLHDIEQMVIEDHPISPPQWVDYGLKINSLRGTMDNESARLEGLFADLTAQYIREDKSASVAEKLAKSGNEYRKYLELKAQLKRIDELIRLAKRRASIDDSQY